MGELHMHTLPLHLNTENPDIWTLYYISLQVKLVLVYYITSKTAVYHTILCPSLLLTNGCWISSRIRIKSQQRTFHRCFLPSFGSFDQTVSEEKNLKNQPIRNKNCLWRPCLYTDRDEFSTLHRGPHIDASYHVSIHMAKRFQRRRI
jgi:hypothetical protein